LRIKKPFKKNLRMLVQINSFLAWNAGIPMDKTILLKNLLNNTGAEYLYPAEFRPWKFITHT